MVIPVFNRAAMLGEAVASVLAQTYRPIEILIVDDGSTDDTAGVAEKLAAAHPEIRVLHTPNGGPGAAREAGRQLVRGEFVQYLDSDDLLLTTKFEVQVAALRRRPECGAAYGRTRLIDGNRQVLNPSYKWTGRDFEALFPALLVDRWWNTHTPLYRRSVTDAVGAWLPTRMAEDWEYDARVGGLRTRLAFCPENVCDTRQHQQGRLTGHARNARTLVDIGRAVTGIHKGALRAGVATGSPEMRHFSRWAFSVARSLGAFGLDAEARQCFETAIATAGPERARGLDFRLYRQLAACIGWRNLGQLANCVEALWPRVGADTLCLSHNTTEYSTDRPEAALSPLSQSTARRRA